MTLDSFYNYLSRSVKCERNNEKSKIYGRAVPVVAVNNSSRYGHSQHQPGDWCAR